MRILRAVHTGEGGQGLLLVLILLSFGAALIVPGLQLAYAATNATRSMEGAMLDQYATDSGVEDALARLKFEGGFADSINEANPALNYSVTANNRATDVAVEYVDQETGAPPEGGPQAWRIQLSKVADPSSGSPGQRLTITYTITVGNAGTSAIHLTEIGDRLPQGFTDVVYVPGSSSGISSANPQVTTVDGRRQLQWDLGSSPGYRIEAGAVATQVFRVEVTIQWDTYLNLAWVVAKPSSIGMVTTGDTAPVEGARHFDVTSRTGTATVKARVALSPDAEVAIISWQAV